MIQVKVVKLKERKRNDLGESLQVVARNAASEAFADNVKKHVRDLKCTEDHPTRLTITITADRRKMMTVKKSAYCCKKFADSIQIEVK